MSVLKGTTNLGFHFNGGTMIAVKGSVTHDMLDSERKFFELSSKALIVCTFMGLTNDWHGMYQYIKEKDPTSVKEATDLAKSYMVKFMEIHKNNYMLKYKIQYNEEVSFGTLIAGYDDEKGFQLCSLTLEQDNKEDVDLATLGSGAWAAQEIVMKSDYKNMTKKAASGLAFRALLESTLVDRHSGRIFHVLHLRKNGFSIAEANLLDVYYEYYDSMNIKETTLFLLHPIRTKQDEIAGDEFIKLIWLSTLEGGAKSYLPHVEVTHQIARKRDFNFYHLVFMTSDEADTAYQCIPHPLKREVTSFYTNDLNDIVSDYFACGSGGNETIYVAKGTKTLLENIHKAVSS